MPRALYGRTGTRTAVLSDAPELFDPAAVIVRTERRTPERPKIKIRAGGNAG